MNLTFDSHFYYLQNMKHNICLYYPFTIRTLPGNCLKPCNQLRKTLHGVNLWPNTNSLIDLTYKTGVKFLYHVYTSVFQSISFNLSMK